MVIRDAADRVKAVREFKGFRHVVRHAYDLEFREERLKKLVVLADEVSSELAAWSEDFVKRTRAEQGWS